MERVEKNRTLWISLLSCTVGRMQYEGEVIGGGKSATQLGFPTANIACEKDRMVSGIYAARIKVDGTQFDAVSYMNKSRDILESHLFDFSGELYGKHISVELLVKLRDDMTFETEEEARAQIGRDVAAARKYFGI